MHRTLLHLGEELLHGVMHFDARVWRTLPLLAFNPGRLTREWVEGRRTRYVSPLAIFLFTLFVMFFALSFMPQPSAPVVLAGDIQEQRQELLEAERGLAEARADAASDPSGMADMGIKAGEALAQAGQLAGQHQGHRLGRRCVGRHDQAEGHGPRGRQG